MTPTHEQIDLSKARVGDRYLSDSGVNWTFVKRGDRGFYMKSEYCCVWFNEKGKSGITADLIRKLPPESAVESQEGLGAPCGQKYGESGCEAAKSKDLDALKARVDRIADVLTDLHAMALPLQPVPALVEPTFAPKQPEPPKSYAEYLSGEDFRVKTNGLSGLLIKRGDLAGNSKRAYALIDFIQDTLAQAEEG